MKPFHLRAMVISCQFTWIPLLWRMRWNGGKEFGEYRYYGIDWFRISLILRINSNNDREK